MCNVKVWLKGCFVFNIFCEHLVYMALIEIGPIFQKMSIFIIFYLGNFSFPEDFFSIVCYMLLAFFATPVDLLLVCIFLVFAFFELPTFVWIVLGRLVKLQNNCVLCSSTFLFLVKKNYKHHYLSPYNVFSQNVHVLGLKQICWSLAGSFWICQKLAFCRVFVI